MAIGDLLTEVLDSFNRADEDPLTTSSAGGTWNTNAWLGNNSFRVTSNELDSDTSSGAGGNDYSVTPAQADMELAMMDITTFSSGDVYLFCRFAGWTGNSRDGYAWNWKDGFGQLKRYDNGSSTGLNSGTITGGSGTSGRVGTGDHVMLRAVGSAIGAYIHDGTSWNLAYTTSSATDSTYSAAGYIGIYCTTGTGVSPFTANSMEWYNGTAEQTISVGTATETDAAQAVGRLKVYDITNASETDAGQAVTVVQPQTIAMGTATETSAGQGITAGKTYAIGTATSTETGQGVSVAKVWNIGVASESDSGVTVSPVKGYTLGTVTSSETAIAATVSKAPTISVASETDAAQAVSWLKEMAMGVGTEVNAAQGITRVKDYLVGLAAESDSGLALTPAKVYNLGVAQEADIAVAVSLAGEPIPVQNPLELVEAQNLSFTLPTPGWNPRTTTIHGPRHGGGSLLCVGVIILGVLHGFIVDYLPL